MPPPLLGIEEHDDEENAGEDESMHVDEVPDPRDADSVPVPGSANKRRDIARIVFCRPDAVARNLERRKPDPFASRRAVVIEIETRMIDQNGEAAADQHHHKKKIEKVTVAHPERKSVRPSEIVGINLRNRRNVSAVRRPRTSIHAARAMRARITSADPDQNGWPNPNAEAAVLWIVHCPVRSIERNHTRITNFSFSPERIRTSAH